MKKTFSLSVICKDEAFSRMIQLEILQNGYTVKSGTQNADAVILDLDSAERGICEKLLSAQIPVVAFSRESAAKTESKTSVAFLRRPFDTSELFFALDGIFEKGESKESKENEEMPSANGLAIKIKREADGSVKINGEKIPLSDTEAALFGLLLEKNGEPLSKKEAMEKIWKNKDENSNIYDVYIHYLRQKIDERFNVKFIKTVREKGYKINF